MKINAKINTNKKSTTKKPAKKPTKRKEFDASSQSLLIKDMQKFVKKHILEIALELQYRNKRGEFAKSAHWFHDACSMAACHDARSIVEAYARSLFLDMACVTAKAEIQRKREAEERRLNPPIKKPTMWHKGKTSAKKATKPANQRHGIHGEF